MEKVRILEKKLEKVREKLGKNWVKIDKKTRKKASQAAIL